MCFPVTSDVSEDFPNTGNVTDKGKLSESEKSVEKCFPEIFFSAKRDGK